MKWPWLVGINAGGCVGNAIMAIVLSAQGHQFFWCSMLISSFCGMVVAANVMEALAKIANKKGGGE